MKRKNMDFDQQVLEFIYESRAVTFEQLAYYFDRTQNVIYKIISKLSKQGLVSTEGISYIKNSDSNFHGKCVFLTSKGISSMKKRGASISKSAERNKPTKNQMPFVLLANEIKINAPVDYWEFLDSREAKEYFNRNYNELFNGILKNKESLVDSVIYVLPALAKGRNETPSEKYFYLLKNELIKHYEQMKTITFEKASQLEHFIHSYIFFCKSKKWFELLIEKILEVDEGSIISRARSVKVMPFNYGINFLVNCASRNQQLSACTEALEQDIRFNDFKINFKEDYSLNQFGVEFEIAFKRDVAYGVNILDFDIKKIHLLNRFTNHYYTKYGSKKVIIITSSIWQQYIQTKLTYPYFEFVFVDY